MKICGRCKTEKELSDYNKNKRTKDGVQRICRTCQRESDRKCYLKGVQLNPRERIERNKVNISRNRAFIIRYKKMFGKCVDCGTTDYRVMQFDHVRGKDGLMSMFASGAYSLKRIKNEIKKCDIRCANCHQIRTHYPE
jgi:hypothetical protein